GERGRAPITRFAGPDIGGTPTGRPQGSPLQVRLLYLYSERLREQQGLTVRRTPCDNRCMGSGRGEAANGRVALRYASAALLAYAAIGVAAHLRLPALL